MLGIETLGREISMLTFGQEKVFFHPTFGNPSHFALSKSPFHSHSLYREKEPQHRSKVCKRVKKK